MGMLCCVYGFGGWINFWTLLAINIFVSTIASLVPIPGGGTAVSSVGMSGALAGAGVPAWGGGGAGGAGCGLGGAVGGGRPRARDPPRPGDPPPREQPARDQRAARDHHREAE